jgi:large subunit ribosomal protein L10
LLVVEQNEQLRTIEGISMVRPDKAAAVAELTEAFRDSSAAVLTEYRGLTVADLKELRRTLSGNATYSVVKNTLTKIAARAAGIDMFDSMLEGPSAIAFVSGDAVEVAKGLRSFGREHPLLIIKGGILDGKPLTADEIRRLADLESREVLLAKFAGGMLAPAQQLASVLAASMGQLARLFGALETKLAADPAAVTGGDGASAVDPQPEAAAEAQAETPAETEPEAAPAPAPAAEAVTETESAPATEAPEAAEVAEPAAEDAATADATSEAATDTTTDDASTDDTVSDDTTTPTDDVADAPPAN